MYEWQRITLKNTNNMDKETIKYIFMIAACVVVAILSILLYRSCRHQEPTPTTVTDTIYKTDTVTIDSVIYKYVQLHHHDTAYFNCIDTLYDSVMVEVPIYEYEIDTTIENTRLQECLYGYNVTVDGIRIETTYPEVTTTIVQPQKPKRWGLGFQAGFGGGYDIISKQPMLGAYIGVGLSYNFLSF